MFKNLGDMAKMMKAAQDMLTDLKVYGRSGGGLVTAEANAKGDILSINIDPSILIASEKEIVEDLILAAIKDAAAKATARHQAEMQNLAASLGLPADFKMPF